MVFDLALSLTYGARMGEVDDAFALTFLRSINDISAGLLDNLPNFFTPFLIKQKSDHLLEISSTMSHYFV